jgi:hypothetical protein
VAPILAADRRSITVNHSSTVPHYVPGMDETQTALQALRELLDDPDRNDWDELVAASRALIKAIETGEAMTQGNARIVAEYLREAGWRERAISAATAQAGRHFRPTTGVGRRPRPPSRGCHCRN